MALLAFPSELHTFTQKNHTKYHEKQKNPSLSCTTPYMAPTKSHLSTTLTLASDPSLVIRLYTPNFIAKQPGAFFNIQTGEGK